MKHKSQYIVIILNTIFIIAICMFLYSLVGPKVADDAYIGKFDVIDYNEGWKRIDHEKEEYVSLPVSVDSNLGETVVLENTLPNDIKDGMRLCTRADVQDIYIYIDGELRVSYTSENASKPVQYLTTSYVLADLAEEDAGKEVRIERTTKTSRKSKCEEVTIGYGNNVWFPIMDKGLPVAVAAFFLTVFGLLAIVGYVIIRKKIMTNKAILYLGETMMVIGLWIIGESEIKQLLFQAPYYSRIYSYFFLEIIGGFVALYFNEVQNRKYNLAYKICTCVVLIQFVINSILNFSGLVIYHNTLTLSHIWMTVSILTAIVTIIIDIKAKRIQNYSITASGMVVFLVACLVEVVNFYAFDFYILGVWLCFGLISMLLATVGQTLHDEIKRIKEQQRHQEKMTIATIETIAGALDAKDEYTGGHCQRVANYAMILARAVADKYNFTEEDIERIHYIGLMHDLGKIGVPDIILNKEGKLTDDEYRLMKLHTIIGKDLLKAIDNIDGLEYGVQYHHERYDGTGYPDGLRGEEIPIYARILCLADCYDAMASNRIYRKRLTDQSIREELERCAGTQFDPYLVKVFLKLMDEGELNVKGVHELQTISKGDVLKTSIMEKKFDFYSVGDEPYETIDPAYIRMIAYMVNCAEKRGETVQIMLLTLKMADRETVSKESIEAGSHILNEILSKTIKQVDISIHYSVLQRIVVLFQVEDDEVYNIAEQMQQLFDEIHKEKDYLFEWKVIH